MPTTRQLLTARNESVTKVRQLKEKIDARTKKGEQPSADDQAALSDAIDDCKIHVSAYNEAKTRQESENAEFLRSIDEIDTAVAERERNTSVTRRSRARQSSGKRRNRSRYGAPNRRDASAYRWKPKGSRWSREVAREDNEEAREDAFFAKMMPEHKGVMAAWNGYDAHDRSALVEDLDSDGGFFVIPERMESEILKNVDDNVAMFRLCRVQTLKNEKSLSILERKNKANSFKFTNALTDITSTMENSLSYGKRSLTPHQFMGAFWIHQDLLASATRDPVSLYMEEMAIDRDEMFEDVLLYGTGNQDGSPCPIGLLYPSDKGIPASRDFNDETTTTAFVGDTFVKGKWKLKPKYRRNARWMMHPDFIAEVATLKTSGGDENYIWSMSRGLDESEPERIMGIPLIDNYFMPDTAGAGLYFAALADFSYYWIVIRGGMQMRRLDEIAARQGLAEFHMRGKIDGAPVLAEAFARFKFADM